LPAWLLGVGNELLGQTAHASRNRTVDGGELAWLVSIPQRPVHASEG